MKIITFPGYEFDPKKLTNKPECPEVLRAKMVKEILSSCPDDVEVKEFSNTTSISRNGKKVNVSAWKFPLADWPEGKPFNYFRKDGSDVVLVWGVQFFDNGKFISDINDAANLRCALGYPMAEENKALFMCGTKAMQWARQFMTNAKEFLSDTDSMVEVVANALPADANLKLSPIGLTGTVPVKDYEVSVGFGNGTFTAVIPHKYTEYDAVYGARYSNYSRTVKFETPEDVAAFDWNALWNDLYENRNGTCTYRGSLGS